MRASDAEDFISNSDSAPLLNVGTGITFARGEVSAYYAARVPDLRQAGRGEWRGPCPLHRGKDNNFAVDPETGQWFCHSVCGRGGDILELEAALRGGNFPTRKAEVFRLVGRAEREYRRDGTRMSGNSANTAGTPEKPARVRGDGAKSNVTRTWIETEDFYSRSSGTSSRMEQGVRSCASERG